MANNKKRKKTQSSHHSGVVIIKQTNSHLRTCFATARRIFLAIGEDEATLEAFTKRQKQEFFRIPALPPRVMAMQGHKVPKQYIRFVQEELIAYLRSEYFDQVTGITWYDMSTVGQSIMLMFFSDSYFENLSDEQRAILKRLHQTYDRLNIIQQLHDTISEQVAAALMYLSQPNFRIYGHEMTEHMLPNRLCLQDIVRITTHESQSLRFKYHNKERTAFRIATGQTLEKPYTAATIAMSKIVPGTTTGKRLNIYIQSHAIHRFKERIDMILSVMRNQFFVISLMFFQRVVQSPDGIPLISCIIPTKDREKAIGYFAFTIDGDNLLVLTFLPLLSYNVPEGRILYDRLHLSLDDLKYLGMDKLSFFFEIDIERIPVLKQVLFDELHLEYIRDVVKDFNLTNLLIDEKKTLFVKNFFQKLNDQPVDRADILNELTDIDI
jgi:hypothetical protein